MSENQTLAQRRAALALKQINSRKGLPPGDQKRYVSYAQALPAVIMMNGLGQAVATHLAAAKGNDSDPHRHLYDDLQAWLCGNAQLPGLPYAGRSDLIREITLHDEAAYLMAQAEALAYCGWLKRFAVAYLKNPDTPGEAE